MEVEVTLQVNGTVNAVLAEVGKVPATWKLMVEAQGMFFTTNAPPPPAVAGRRAATA